MKIYTLIPTLLVAVAFVQGHPGNGLKTGHPDHSRCQQCDYGEDAMACLLPDPLNCSKYYTCQKDFASPTGWIEYHMECPENTQFDTSLNVCNWASEVVCMDPTICNGLGKNYQYLLGKCYYIEENLLNQADAKENCENRFGVYGDGILFEPKDKNTNDKVIEFARYLIKGSGFFIGIKDFNSNNNWKYLSNNRKLSWTNWNAGQPNNDYGTIENCVSALEITPNKWHDVPCNIQDYSSICEMKTT